MKITKAIVISMSLAMCVLAFCHQLARAQEGTSAIVITITKSETHNVRDEAIERVARQLCGADGKDCEADIRCGVSSGGFSTCNSVHIDYPANRVWFAYRDRAEQILKDAFK